MSVGTQCAFYGTVNRHVRLSPPVTLLRLQVTRRGRVPPRVPLEPPVLCALMQDVTTVEVTMNNTTLFRDTLEYWLRPIFLLYY